MARTCSTCRHLRTARPRLSPETGGAITANATLGGDTLTLGEGGIFVSEDITTTIDAALAGNVAVHGPGIAQFASASTLPSLYVGFGSNVELPAGSSIAGNLTMREGSQIIVDVSSCVTPRSLTTSSRGTRSRLPASSSCRMRRRCVAVISSRRMTTA